MNDFLKGKINQLSKFYMLHKDVAGKPGIVANLHNHSYGALLNLMIHMIEEINKKQA